MIYRGEVISDNIGFNYKVKLVRSIQGIFKVINILTGEALRTFIKIPLIKYLFIGAKVNKRSSDRLAVVVPISPMHTPYNSEIIYTPKLLPSFILIKCGDVNGGVYTQYISYHGWGSDGLYIKKVIIPTARYNCVIGAQFVLNQFYQSFR